MAVFLALGLGITLGYTLVVSEKIDPLHSQIQEVRKQNSTVQDENKRLQQALDSLAQQHQDLQDEVDQLIPLTVAGRLSGRTVSVISVGPPPAPSLVDSVWRALLTADARRLNEVVIRGSLLPVDPRAAQEIKSRLQIDPASDPAEAVTSAVARALATGQGSTLLPALMHRGVPIDASGDFTAAPNLVVLLCQVDTPGRLQAVEQGITPETALVRAFQSAGIRVVECESSTAPESAASYFRRLGISAIDNVDTREGRISLVWACLGYAGHYGTRRSADSPLPDLGQS